MSAVLPPEQPTGKALWAAIGGVRGVVESVLPPLAFLVVFAVTKDVWWSALAPVALAVVFLVARLVQRQSVMPAIGGLVIVAVSAVAALLTGNANNNFIPGFVINGICLLLLLVTLVVRRPLLGAIVAVLNGRVEGWWRDARFRGRATAASWVWVGLFAVRLGVELPLYFAQATEPLALARLLTGIPLYAVAVWFTWLLMRSPKAADGDGDEGAGAPVDEPSEA